jgi:hypothetical protein
VFFKSKAINIIAQPYDRSLEFIESVNRKDLFDLGALAAITANLATAKPLVEFLLKWVWLFFNTKAINILAQP